MLGHITPVCSRHFHQPVDKLFNEMQLIMIRSLLSVQVAGLSTALYDILAYHVFDYAGCLAVSP